MATEILLPRLGWTMEEGIFGEWLVKDGTSVQEGDLIFTMEGDKATQEIEALEAGILRIAPTGPRAGDVVPVGALLGYLLAEGEIAPFEEGGTGTSDPVISKPEISNPSAPDMRADASNISASTTNELVTIVLGKTMPASTPRARRVAAELDVDWRELQGSGRTGRIVERDVRAAVEARQSQPSEEPSVRATSVKATPVAQRVAREAGIDIAEVAPTGAGGRVQRQDVENEVARRSEPTHALSTTEQSGVGARLPHSRTRRIIAQRMVQSRQTTAPVTLHTEVDATTFVALRAQARAAYTKRNLPAPTYNDLLIKLVAVALRNHPALNATWEEDALLIWEEIHIGIAVDTEGGLLAPVIRNVRDKSIARIAAESRDLIARAQSGKASTAEVQGGTFTISNLGMFGIDAFTPVINLPECAILGIGRITEKPVVREEQIVARSMMTLSLTFDHRVVDGAPAARFLQQVREFIEDPALWTME